MYMFFEAKGIQKIKVLSFPVFLLETIYAVVKKKSDFAI